MTLNTISAILLSVNCKLKKCLSSIFHTCFLLAIYLNEHIFSLQCSPAEKVASMITVCGQKDQQKVAMVKVNAYFTGRR